MNKFHPIRVLLLILLCTILCACAEETAVSANVELWVLNVGKGDAIVVKTDEKAYLIDTAKNFRFGVILSALKENGIDRLDGVFLTHTDSDHTGGLTLLAQSDIEVGAWYASAYCLDVKNESKHPAVQAAATRGQSVVWLRQGDSVDGLFSVLAPARPAQDKDDNNSLVMLLTVSGGNVLLTGDMEYAEEPDVLNGRTDLKCAVLKVPNHGDDDTLSAQFLNACRPTLALISTDPYEKPGTPDNALLERLKAIGADVYRTDASEMGIHVTVDTNGVFAKYAKWKTASAQPLPVSVTDVNAKNDTVTLFNASETSVDLEGYLLYSDRGKEAYLFPKGTVLASGASLTVGTRSSSGAFDMLWDDKNVIHDSKTDVLTLYDAYGRTVCVADNGL